MAYAPCKRLCVEYMTFARIAAYCVRIVRLVRVSDLLSTYTACALEATLCVLGTSVRVKLLNADVNVRLLRVSDLCARSDLCVRCTTCASDVRLNAHVNVRLLRVEQLLPPFPTVSFNDVSYSTGLFDRVTRAICDHSCDGPILGFLT